MKPCPEPNKAAFSSRAAARRHLKKMLRRNNRSKHNLHPYRCVCTKWHVGHGQIPREPRKRTRS